LALLSFAFCSGNSSSAFRYSCAFCLLESFGRSGVPLYVLYGAGSATPTLLPQLLTETLVLDALRDLSGKTKLTDSRNRRSS
jgi:hypothetical protein